MTPDRIVRRAVRTQRRRVSRFLLLALLAMAGSLLLAACGGGSSDGPADAGTSTQTVDLEVPNFVISTYQGADVLGGEEVTVAELLALGKPLYLNFWAALCPPCRAEMPDIQRVYEVYGDDVTIVGVDLGPFQLLGTREEGKELLIELEVTYPAGTTFDVDAVRELRILGMPTSLFITTNGELQRRWTGFLTEDKLGEFIEELLAES